MMYLKIRAFPCAAVFDKTLLINEGLTTKLLPIFLSVLRASVAGSVSWG